MSSLTKFGKNHEYILYCNQENFPSFLSRDKNLKRTLINIPARLKILRLLCEQLLLPFYAYFQKVETLVSFGYVCPLFLPCKSVVFIYDLNWYFHPEEFSFIERNVWKILVTLSAKRADMIITSSISSQKDIIKILKINRNKVIVIYGGVDLKRFKEIKRSKEIMEIREKYGITKNYILTVSAAYKFKNLVFLIKAFKDVEGDYQLVIVGLRGRGRPALLKTIKDLGLEDKVIIAGWVPNDDLPVLYSGAEIYVHPSLYEGFGFPVLEAMASGCPVVSSSSASLPELVGKAGILVNARKRRLFSKRMKYVLSDVKIARKFRERGYVQSRQFTWAKAGSKFMAILEQK